jgi:EmrB/QacA subfamily drug resistance transporter
VENLIVTDPRRQRWIILSVCFSLFMVCLDSYIVNISLPTIAHYFDANMGTVSRVVQAYLLVLTSTLLLFGKLGDQFGFKRMFMVGYIIFVAGSLLCGIAVNVAMLTTARCIQGLGGSMLYAVGPATIPKYLPKEIRGAAFGKVAMAAALGLTLGAPLGGLITAHFSWQWIFLINVPVGLAAIFVARRALPSATQSEPKAGDAHVDIAGGILNFIAILVLLYGLNLGRRVGWNSLFIWSCFIMAALAFAGFIWRERRCRNPILDLHLFRNRSFTLANFSNMLAFSALAGNAFLLPFYLEQAKKLKPDQAGLVFMVLSAVMMIVAPLAGKLSDRIRPERLCTVSMILAASALVFFVVMLPGEGLTVVILYLVWFAFGLGSFVPPNNNLVMSGAPIDRQGSASALLKASSNLGMALGVCIYATIFTEVISGGAGNSSVSLSHANIPTERLFHAFRCAYLVGAGATLVAMGILLAVRSGEAAPVPAAKADAIST